MPNTRKYSPQLTGLALGILCIIASILSAQSQTGSSKPNIVVILSDDVGWGDISCYQPSNKFKTPAVDKLAREGTRFTNAHAPHSVCTPTRYALLTGRYC